MDIELLNRVKSGDNEAFAKLYSLYADSAIRVAAAVTGNKINAADAVQETFIKVYRNISGFQEDRPFDPWFYRILINECKRILGKNSKTLLVEDFTVPGLNAGLEDDYNFEEYEVLYKAIESLQDINRVPIVLKYLKDFKESEIAEILGENINTIKSRLFKGRQRLRSAIEKLERKAQANNKVKSGKISRTERGEENYESYGG